MNTVSAGAIVWAAVGILASAAVGVTVGLTGVVTRPTVVDASAAATIALATADASDCAGGPVIATLQAGQRVLVVEQSADAGWVGVRNPSKPSETLWLAQSVVTRDDAEPSAVALPTGGECPTVTTEVGFANAAPEPEAPAAAAPGAPGTTPSQPPAGDTSSPQLNAPTAQPAVIGCSAGYPYPTSSLISVAAGDNVAVTRVDISWTGSYSGSSTMSKNGPTWTFTFDATGPGDRGDVNVSMVAWDAAGNRSGASTVSLFVDCVI